jgi:hypothetical protein
VYIHLGRLGLPASENRQVIDISQVNHTSDDLVLGLQLRLIRCNARTIVNVCRTAMLINKRRFSTNTFIDSFGGGIR